MVSIFDDDFVVKFISVAVDDFLKSVGWDNNDETNIDNDNDDN